MTKVLSVILEHKPISVKLNLLKKRLTRLKRNNIQTYQNLSKYPLRRTKT